MPHTHHTTLISAANLAARLAAAPGSALIFDCRFDLAAPGAGEAACATGHLPGAHYLHLDRDLSGVKTGTNGRHPLPDRAALVATLAGFGLNEGQQVIAYDAQDGMYCRALVDGRCAGSGTIPSRCSTAACWPGKPPAGHSTRRCRRRRRAISRRASRSR